MKRHKCILCGYIYEPEKGDPDAAIPTGTEFEALPEDWTCPLCRMDKSKFIEIEITESGGYYEAPTLEEQQIAPKNDSRIDKNNKNENT